MKLQVFLVYGLIYSLLATPAFAVKGEPAGGDETAFTYIAPNEQVAGSGEFVHGAGRGKLLVRVLMLGSIDQQGIHYFPENTNLLDAVLLAGGIDDTSKLNGITIRRKGKQELIDVALEDLLEDGEAIPFLVDGDVVNIPWNWRKDIGNITLVTGFISSITAFTLAMIALAK
ncbi:MAG: hypothetical protein KDD51_03020 [Bdellovibrionales bacterium]|nr:hypothetical protein [Bdellovibrionales bacterium]